MLLQSITWSFVLSCFTVSICLAQELNTPSQSELNNTFSNYLDENFGAVLPGYAIGIVIDGKRVFTKVDGERKIGSGEPINENTVFRLASVSKTFPAAAVGKIQSPSLDFDSFMHQLLPKVKLSNPHYQSSITLRHVLSHSTGLMPHAYTNLVQDNVPYHKIVNRLDKVNFVCSPGSCYGYQNVVYSLIGDVIAEVADTSYEQTIKERIFDPLGMKHSSFGLEAFTQATNHATPHRWDRGNKRWLATHVKENYYQLSPAAGINASLNDMLLWLETQLGLYPHIIDHALLDEIQRPHIKTSRRRAHYRNKLWDGVSDTHYALGWRTFHFRGEQGFVHHGGWVEGFRAEIVLNRRLNMGMIFLTNSEPGIASEIVPTFIRWYLDNHEENNTSPALVSVAGESLKSDQ